MALELVLTFLVLVGLVLLALAVWLLAVDFRNSVYRAFALFFFLRGFQIVLNQVARIDPGNTGLYDGVRPYILIAMTASIINIFLVYRWRERTPPVRLARAGLLLVAILFEAIYLLDHRQHGFVHSTEGFTFGPLGIFTQAFLPLLALLALWFALEAARTRSAAQARFHRLLALAFGAMALTDGMLAWSIPPTDGWGPIFRPYDHAPHVLAQSMYVVTAPIALGAFAMLLRTTPPGNARRWTVGVAAFCAVLPFVGGLLSPSDHDGSVFSFAVFFLPLGLARLAGASIMAYALVRQNPLRVDAFALDWRLRLGLGRGTVGGIIVATFFVMSQVAEELVPSLFDDLGAFQSQTLGAVAAGLLLLALTPLKRFGDRLSGSVLPHARPASQMRLEDRVRLYEEQASIAWADGILTRKERIFLDRLRERLDIDPGRVQAIEAVLVDRSAHGTSTAWR